MLSTRLAFAFKNQARYIEFGRITHHPVYFIDTRDGLCIILRITPGHDDRGIFILTL